MTEPYTARMAVHADRAATLLRERFGHDASWISAAPGRVNLIGEHTDYNNGFVLPMAIDRCVVAAAAPANRLQPMANCYSAELEQEATVKVGGTIAPGIATWSSFVQGVIAGFIDRGFEFRPFDMVILSNLPVGGGLSSSAALAVATATLIEAMLGESLEPIDKALLCQEAEHKFAGVPCGIMDQFSSIFGRADAAMLLDCADQKLEFVPLDPAVSVLIANTNVKHELTGGEYERRRSQCETAAETIGVPFLRDATMDQLEAQQDALDPTCFRRARHVIAEIQRTLQAAQLLKQRDWHQVGDLMYESHDSLRDDYEVSTDELDAMVGIARGMGKAGGVYGSRMTGAGFGGCTVSLVAQERAEMIADRMRLQYRKRVGIMPSIFVTRAVPGAQAITNLRPVDEGQA